MATKTKGEGAPSKTIIIIVDGMRADVAHKSWGYLQMLCDSSNAVSLKCKADNPSVSLTCYETIVTGKASTDHGVTGNYFQGKSRMKQNLFKHFKTHKRSTAAVASSWFYQLYGRDKEFKVSKHKQYWNNKKEQIETAFFHTSDSFPDSEAMEIAANIIHKNKPDCLLIHIAQIDEIGHSQGVGQAYHYQAEIVDELFSYYFPFWLKENYTIIVTADHGMNEHKTHGTLEPEVLAVPLYVVSKNKQRIKAADAKRTYHQKDILSVFVCNAG